MIKLIIPTEEYLQSYKEAFDEYVSTTYIETTYRRIDRNIRSAFTRRALEESDMLAILNHLINM